jgi:hypothetical protein
MMNGSSLPQCHSGLEPMRQAKCFLTLHDREQQRDSNKDVLRKSSAIISDQMLAHKIPFDITPNETNFDVRYTLKFESFARHICMQRTCQILYALIPNGI